MRGTRRSDNCFLSVCRQPPSQHRSAGSLRPHAQGNADGPPSAFAIHTIATLGHQLRLVHLLAYQQIDLQWERLIVTMRTADLLVLHQALQKYRVAVAREWVELYRLSLNDCVLFIRGDDLYHFCALVQGTVEHLPRRTVRWTDLQVQVAPYAADGLPNVGCFPITKFGSVVAGCRLEQR